MFYASTKNTRRWGATRFPHWLEAVVGYVVFVVVSYALAVWGDVDYPLRGAVCTGCVLRARRRGVRSDPLALATPRTTGPCGDRPTDHEMAVTT